MYHVLGQSYKGALPFFWITGTGMALVSGIGYYTIMIHTIQLPHIEAIVNVARLLVMVVLGPVMTGMFGGLALAGILLGGCGGGGDLGSWLRVYG